MPRHELDARLEFAYDAVDPGGFDDAVGVGEAQDVAFADVDELAEGVLLGAYPFGNVLNGEDMQPRVARRIFREDFRGVVRTAVVGDPYVPLAVIFLRKHRIEGGADAGRLVAGRNQDTHVGLGLHVGLAVAYRTEGAEKAHQEGYVEQPGYGEEAYDHVCQNRPNHFFGQKFSSSCRNFGLRVQERGGDFSIHIYMLM